MSDPKNIRGEIRRTFDELCQKRQISIYGDGPASGVAVSHKQLSGILDALIDAVAVEISIRTKEQG